MNRKLHRDVWVGVVLLVFSLFALMCSVKIKGQSAAVPIALSVMMAVCAVLISLGGFRKTRELNGEYNYKMTVRGSRYALQYMGFIFLYFIGFRLLSYWIATPIFLILSMKHLKVKSWKLNITITVVYMVLSYVVFVIILKLPIYKVGIFGRFFRFV